MKIDHKTFENLLRAKKINKKAFAAYSDIPYDTVAGWKKSGKVPAYAMVLLRSMPFPETYVTADDLLRAGLPRAVLWNNDPHKEVPVDLFIVATLQRAYNDFVIEKMAEFFGPQRVLGAVLKHQKRLSDALVDRVVSCLETPRSAA